MAASAVGPVINKLAALLTEEVELLKGVHKEVEVIKDDLEAIRAFLKDADSKVEKEGVNEGVKVWVKQVREVAYQIEDVIDKYVIHVARHHDQHGFIGFLQRISFFVKQLKPCHNIASEVQYVRSTLQNVRDRSREFHLVSSGQGASSSSAGKVVLHDPRMSSLSISEAELVDIVSRRDELISLLVDDTPKRKVISVVGLGGGGKTTLTKKVYDSRRVKSHFECHTWITVSQSYDRVEILRRILREFVPQDIVSMDGPSVISKLKEFLRSKRCLVVFDDVWDIAFWGDVEDALFDTNNGSRVLFTTRKEDVATFCKRSSLVDVYMMKLLTQQEAWELFCKKTFKFEFGGKCPEHLEILSQDIVKRCGGLPLAVAAIGGLLATKEKTVPEWSKLLHGLGSKLADDPHLESVIKILSLSYGDLPYSLKSCFLYLGMFLEDSFIKRRRLISLWASGGFIEEKQDMTLEEVAEEHLIELIHRSLVQVVEVNIKGIPRTCRVHDMVREVILSKLEELSFCHVSSSRALLEGIARHLSVSSYKEKENSKSSTTKFQTRSIMVFGHRELQKPTIDAIFAQFKLLTSLDLQDCVIDEIPKGLGKLVHLRYFSLRRTYLSKLPKSIRKLHNLEYLDLRCGLKELSIKIDWFPKLRHYLGTGRNKIHGSIAHLKLLQTLYWIEIDDVRLIKELGTLKQLRRLTIVDLKGDYERHLCISLEKMTHLQYLTIYACGEILEVQSMSSPPLHLQTLKLAGKLERLPQWIAKLDSLSKLQLWVSELKDDPIQILQALPNLASLSLYRVYDGEKMHFGEGGFQKLKRLYFVELAKLNTVIVDKGAMPLLEELSIERCQQLKDLPSGIQHMKGLKTLRFSLVSDDFKRRLDMDGGADYWMVKHVPNIYYDGELLSHPNDQ